MVDDTLRPRLGWSVAELIAGGVAAERVARTDIAQPLLFAIQVGIVEALRAAGVTAGGFLGHSVGEIAAAWAAGALSLAEAGRVVVARSRSQQRTQGAGRMAAVALDSDAARELSRRARQQRRDRGDQCRAFGDAVGLGRGNRSARCSRRTGAISGFAGSISTSRSIPNRWIRSGRSC